MSFAEDMATHLPDGLTLPTAFVRTFDWLEAQGWHDTVPNGDPQDFGNRMLFIYPQAARNLPSASHVVFRFEAGPPLYQPPPEAMARVATIAKIAGDGGTLSLWLDDDGKQWIVVFNHGIPYVLTDDALIALQFLALGYTEPGAITDPGLTPIEHALQDFGDPPVPPLEFRAFLTDTFGVTLPDRASALGITIPADIAPDPIRDWIEAVMPEPEIGAIPGMTPENPYVITSELREILGEEGIAILRESYEYVIEEE
ncbi:hypothetical protein [Hasllibacter sp. MH4015]|uniref:hypothetical protein n=1 Tax=Hasllibacter sp. MH4015 TaxID=2854029 RepID=UPI001CD35AF2|nr:hypothetical protein [Hasllibacter sp. MH4015]